MNYYQNSPYFQISMNDTHFMKFLHTLANLSESIPCMLITEKSKVPTCQPHLILPLKHLHDKIKIILTLESPYQLYAWHLLLPIFLFQLI